MTVAELCARYPPHSDIATRRQVFSCPHCGARVLGPDPQEERPTWLIPLLCCATERVRDWDLGTPRERPLLEPGHSLVLDRTLELRRHVLWHRRTGRRIVLWLPAA